MARNTENQITWIKNKAENDLEAFIQLVHPKRVLGSVHRELIRWWDRDAAKRHQLTLLPRDHQKSALVAYRAAQLITRNPATRILYISSTANLAYKQAKFIKDILTSDIYRRYWPEMVNPDEGKREKWSEAEFAVDHPRRKDEAIRDPTVFCAGLTTTVTGMHCDVAILDDVVIQENAYTEDGREKVRQQYSLLSSIEGAEGEEWVVGTRYHPRDLYNTMLSKMVDVYDGNMNPTGEKEPLYEVFERQVEDRGDGTGQFLWPRQQGPSGQWFGFDPKILAVKRAQYDTNPTQFRAQYYNDPNDYEGAGIGRENFQYYDRRFLGRTDGVWTFKGRRLNVFASIDFAYSLAKRADYTAITVVGVDNLQNYYVLDIDRFKTDEGAHGYFKHILQLHQKWGFRKLRAEVTAAQDVIVKTIKNDHIRAHGLALSIDEYRPSRQEGTKRERINSILQPKYKNHQVWHYEGGECQTLEEELIMSNPPHDDVKDSLASCIDVAVAPSGGMNVPHSDQFGFKSHSRFGGII